MAAATRSRPVHVAAALALELGIVMTGSRGGLLASLAVLGVVVLYGSARRAIKVTVAAVAVVFLVGLLVVQPARIGERQVTQTQSSSGRTDIWTVALHACPDYCVSGAGWGTFPILYSQQLEEVPQARVLVQGVAYQPHDIFLLALLETGVFSLVLLVAGLGVALVGSLRLPAAVRAPPTAAVLGTVVSSIFLSNLEFKFLWVVLAYPVVCQAAASRLARPAGPVAEPPVAVPEEAH
jgi:O-antigen ligase